jgi:hypothetical protein
LHPERRGGQQLDLLLFLLPPLLSLLFSQFPSLFFGFFLLFSQLVILRYLDLEPLLEEETCREKEGGREGERAMSNAVSEGTLPG